jgi:hypothetical protein
VSGRRFGPGGPVLAALLLAPALSLQPRLASPAAAAADTLREVVSATYVADPDAKAVHVALAETATNLRPDSLGTGFRTQYYYNEILLGIHADATALVVSDARGKLRVTRQHKDGYDLLTIRLRSAIFYRQSATFRVRYDLPGGAPRSDSEIRVGQAFVGVYLYAWGDPGQGSVRVELPAGFEPEIAGDALSRSESGGKVVLTASAIKNPADWFAVLTANRDAGLAKTPIALGSGDTITIRAWPEDGEWQTRVADVLRSGAPRLSELIGLAWPVRGDLTVTEVQSASLEGYAGIYDLTNDTIVISEDLDDLTIVHEAAHAWFNSDLFDDRWITEGLADTYAGLVLDDLKLGTYDPPTHPVANGPGAITLNNWAFPGRIADDETQAREDYGYNASWYIVRELVTEVGQPKMRDVLRAAQDDQIAYLGDGAPEKDFARGWRRFLDLLEERGDSKQADELFIAFVVSDRQQADLAARAEAREAYAKLIADGVAAGGWLPPLVIRDAMAKWRFDEAGPWMTEATGILGDEANLEGRAQGLDLTLPDDVARAWNASTKDFTGAHAAVSALGAAIDDLAAARSALDAERDVIVTVGLLGTKPEDGWSAAVSAFEADDLAAADAATDEIDAMLARAPDDGRTRLGAGGAVVLGGVVVVGLLAGRRRRRRRVTPVGATTAPGVVEVAAPESMATAATLPADPVSDSREPVTAPGLAPAAEPPPASPPPPPPASAPEA